jgi:hypothetical protein
MELIEILLFSAMAQLLAEAIDVLWPETRSERGRPALSSFYGVGSVARSRS